MIQEELLKDFESNSNLSNWFGREDEAPPAVVVKKPHPKNVQNTEKIKELEEQIQKYVGIFRYPGGTDANADGYRLQRERHSLNALLRPPSIPRVKPPIPKESDEKEPSQRQPSASQTDEVDLSILDLSQQKILSSLQQPVTGSPSGQSESSFPPIPPSAVSSRLARIADGLGPTLDSLAAGVHDVELYRSMSDRVSSRVLRICAERLDERDARNAMHRVAIEGEGEGDEDSKEKGVARLRRGEQREDLGIILGALSRVERR